MDSIYTFCQTLHTCTYLPIHYYKNGELKLVLPGSDLPFDLAAPFYSTLLKEQQPVSYVITNEYNYFGLIHNSKTKQSILIGPVISHPLSPDSIRNIMKEYAISLDYKEKLTELYQFTPNFSFHQFCHFIALFYQELFGEFIDIESFWGLYSNEHESVIASMHSAKRYETQEMERFHNTYHYEQQYLNYIRSGNVDGLREFFSNAVPLQVGTIADTPLRQAKNIFIVAVALVTRCAIEGGLDIESAYQLSDIYIQEAETQQNEVTLHRLQRNMFFDFANRVAQAKLPFDADSELSKCIQYIQTHTNQTLSVEDVAKHIGKSRSHVSRSFKKELGFTMNEFIMRCKLEEAKSLLAYTDKSISEISNYLCFSSQAYFQNVFKKKYGVTPNAYRKHPTAGV